MVVHLGSPSGSDWSGVLSEDPIDLLKLLAIGYPEPAYLEQHNKPLKEISREDGQFYTQPIGFQNFLTESLKIQVSECATDFLTYKSADWSEQKGDPFALWLEEIDPD